jgi:isopenicillin N synthase-like dioxygenase
MRDSVPELSLADYRCADPSQREAFAAALRRGFERYGFVILRDHLVASDLIGAAYALAARFFAQDEAVKRGYVAGPRGYAPFRTEHAKNQTTPDLKEFWQIGPEPVPHVAGSGAAIGGAAGGTLPLNLWPEFPAGFRETFVALFDALQATGRVILEALAPTLALPAGFFDGLLHQRNSVLRLLHYPPIGGDAEAGAVRSAAHEDINLITLLLAPQGPGLELLDRDGRWLAVETHVNDLIVDSGDMLARLTNDAIPATTHRVVNPTAENLSRYSMPFFMHPDADVVLGCLPSCIGTGAKYPDIRAGTFLEQRLREIGLMQVPGLDTADRDSGAGR